MGKDTKIEWANHTHNHWIGCSKVSPGCANCYAEEMMDHRFGRVEWGPNGTRKLTSEVNRKKPLQWNREAESKGIRYRVFCSSLADVFEDRPELVPWRADLFRLIHETPNLDWLLLTKRPENWRRHICEVMNIAWSVPQAWSPFAQWVENWLTHHNDPPENVWIGTSVENQQTADERIPHLLQIPARVRFLSCEPLLSEVYLSQWIPTIDTPSPESQCPECGGDVAAEGEGWRCVEHRGVHIGCGWEATYESGAEPDARDSIHWVIVGGESGPNARPMHPDWARSLRDQCQAAGVAFHFKQWGEWSPLTSPDARRWCHLYPDVRMDAHHQPGATTCMSMVGKAKAGRLLDGREWDDVPEVTA